MPESDLWPLDVSRIEPLWDREGLHYRLGGGHVLRYRDLRDGCDLPRWEYINKFGYAVNRFRTYEGAIKYNVATTCREQDPSLCGCTMD